MKFIIYLLFLCISFNSFLDAKTVSINETNKDISLLENSEIFIDIGAKQTIENILSNKINFQEFNHNYLNRGYTTDEAVWVKFTIENNSKEKLERVLHIDNPILDLITLYRNDGNQENKGLLSYSSFDGILDFYFSIILEPKSIQTYYLRILSNSSSTNFHLNLSTKDILWEKSLIQQLIYTVSFAALATLILYNLLLFLFTKEKVYLFYVLAMLTLSYNHLSYTGMNIYIFKILYLDDEIPNLIETDTYLGIYYLGLSAIFVLLFVREFMSIKNYPKIDLMFKIQIFISIILMIFSTKTFYLIDLMIYLCLFVTFFILCIAIYLFIKKTENSLYFLIGWGINALGQFFFLLYNMGIYLQNDKYWYFYEISMVFEAILFSIILAKKLNHTKALAKALETEKILIKELHHRVKNNLQFIISLYRLKLRSYLDEEGRNKLSQIEGNIYSISKIHEILYSHQNISKIDASEYLENLIKEIKRAYPKNKIKIDIHTEISLNINHAINCALIINELVTNAIKYAFDDDSGEINITYKKNEKEGFILIISDNGKGFIKEEKKNSFGLSIVERLVKDGLRGTIEFTGNNGSFYTIKWS